MVYIIAEIGKNADGDLGRARELVRACAVAGANAVRFSHFSIEECVHPSALRGDAERAWSLKLELPFLSETLFDATGYREIVRTCAAVGIDFVASPWDTPSLRLFDGIGVMDYKVSSLNAYNVPLVAAVLEIARRTYLSTGGLDEAQVARMVRELKLADHDVVLLHAVTAYPAPAPVLNLAALDVLHTLHPQVGYASNDLLATSALAACAAGATVLDKHVHLVDGVGPNHRASVDVSELARLIAEVREFEAALGRARKYESRGEMANRDVFAKGLVLARDIPAGQPITADDLALQLPPKGLPARALVRCPRNTRGARPGRGQLPVQRRHRRRGWRPRGQRPRPARDGAGAAWRRGSAQGHRRDDRGSRLRLRRGALRGTRSGTAG